MKKFLFLIMLCFPLFVYASSDITQEIYIQENGDLLIKKEVLLYGDYNGFQYDLKYKYEDEYEIYSADSYEVIRVCERKNFELNCF